MTTQRDFLNAGPSVVTGSTNEFLTKLMAEQSDYLADIALYLRRQNADVLASAVVKGTSQLTNAITDLNSHEVVFQVSGKPVEVYKILVYNTYVNTVYLSVLSMANLYDGIPVVAGASFDFSIPTNSVYLRLAAIAGASCPINGPADIVNGGFFVYGFTTSDFDYGSRRR